MELTDFAVEDAQRRVPTAGTSLHALAGTTFRVCASKIPRSTLGMTAWGSVRRISRRRTSECPATFPVIDLGGVRALVDTGSPLSFGKPLRILR